MTSNDALPQLLGRDAETRVLGRLVGRVRSGASDVLVLRGSDDLVAPRDWCEQVVRLLPDGTLAEIPEHGHETMIRDSSLAADLILGFAERS